MTARHRTGVLLLITALAALCVTGCAGEQDVDVLPGETGSSASSVTGQRFPDVEDVEATQEDSGAWTFDVTMTSPYDSADRYADGWRVTSADGEDVYGEMTLGHDHASEQPFTRTQSGVVVPEGVEEVLVEGHDTDNGYGGATATVMLD